VSTLVFSTDAIIQTISMPTNSESGPDVGTKTIASGWGKDRDGLGGISPVLRKVVDLPIMSNADCGAVYGSAVIGTGVVCVNTEGGRGTCSVSFVFIKYY
jgi:hypothetical protein